MSTESIFRYGKTPRSGALEANFALVKATVDCGQVAFGSNLKQEGKNLRGTCPLPEHQGNSRSFYVYPNEGGFYDSWYCHRCATGGDVIDLYGKMAGLEHNAVWAMQGLAEENGIRLWRDEDVMSDSEITIARAKRKAEKNLERYYTEKYFEEHVVPGIMEIEDDGQRAVELEKALKIAGLDR